MYPVNHYQIKEQFNRETYKAKFGNEPPTYDAALPPKSWVGSGSFKVFSDAGGNAAIADLVIPPIQDGVNLPGRKSYPTWAPAPTTAMTGAASGNSTSVNPAYLSTKADAEALMAELNGSSLYDEGDSAFPPFKISYPADETRRMWAFVANGRPVVAGSLLMQKYAHGVGAPGKWDLSQGEPAWDSEALTSDPPVTLSPVPVPVDIPAGAIFVPGGPFGGWQVKLAGEADPGSAPAAGGLTADQAAALHRVDAYLRKLATMNGVNYDAF